MSKSKPNDVLGSDSRFQLSLETLPLKPPDSAEATVKKRYSEKVSAAVAYALADELRLRGLAGTRPNAPGAEDGSGAERRMAGGIGAKKVDVTWASEESGLLLGMSVKSINFRDGRTKNFQKNLINRRGDMLFEGVTLHRRFPYAVLIGMFFLDEGAAEDGTGKRASTFLNAHDRLAMFTGRTDPAGRDEQFECMYLVLLNADKRPARADFWRVGERDEQVKLDDLLAEAVEQVARRNPDFYQASEGRLIKVIGSARSAKSSSDSEDEE